MAIVQPFFEAYGVFFQALRPRNAAIVKSKLRSKLPDKLCMVKWVQFFVVLLAS